jgi:hypothetical protein
MAGEELVIVVGPNHSSFLNALVPHIFRCQTCLEVESATGASELSIFLQRYNNGPDGTPRADGASIELILLRFGQSSLCKDG